MDDGGLLCGVGPVWDGDPVGVARRRSLGLPSGVVVVMCGPALVQQFCARVSFQRARRASLGRLSRWVHQARFSP